MTVNLQAPNPSNILAVPGVRLGIAEAGVRKVGRKDLTVILLDEGSAVAGVFTQNRYCAAPVQVCREHLKQVTSAVDSQIRALVITPATRMRAQAPKAWPTPALLQMHWRVCSTSSHNRSCRFPQA